jgi:Mitochondrial ribosomal protein (VAR1)
MKIIKSFFSVYNEILEKKIRTKRLLLRLRRLSSNRIYLSNSEFKHNNNNVLINIYIFNRQKHNYISKLKNIFLRKILGKKKVKNNLVKLLKSIYVKGLDTIKQVNKNKYILIKALNIIEKNKNYKIITLKNLSDDKTIFFYKKYLKLKMKKIRLYFFYKQLIYLNRSKLNYTYLRLLKKNLENLYNKNVEFNIVNLKRFYLNSDILSESIKLKITRNRKKMRNILNKLKNKVKIHKKNLFLGSKPAVENKLKKIKDTKLLKKIIFNNLKYKRVTGFRLEARGRLGKRYTASRSVFKLKYKGNLLNLDSSYKGISSVILKGNLKSNIQYTKLKSKTRIGSFGLKG